MNYKGLIPAEQVDVELATPHWKYGTIENGIKVIDPLLHYGCFTLGYDCKEIIDYACNQVKIQKPEVAEAMISDEKIRLNHISFKLQDKLYSLTGGFRSFWCLSGSDANEGAVKLASAYHYESNNKHKKYFVSIDKSYHGSTFLSSNLGYENLMDHPLYTMDRYDNIIKVSKDFSVSDVNWESVAAFVVETCSYGGKMEPYSNEFWEKLNYIREQYNVLIIIDDIFIGGGKTGNFCGWKDLPVVPDIFTMGKAITGGFFPLAITFYNEKIHRSLPDNFRWDHGFTYNFSLAGVASVLKYLEILEREKYLTKHNDNITRAKAVFKKAKYTIQNSFGNYFMVKKGRKPAILYMIPINADDEYFTVLEKNLQ